MLVIRKKTIESLALSYGEPNMLYGYGTAQGFSAVTQDVVLLANDKKVILLFIGRISKRLVQKIAFTKEELSESTLKSDGLLSDNWQFKAGNQKWIVKIQRTILTLGNSQKQFLAFINQTFVVQEF